MPEGDDGERQRGLFDGNGNSDRWADPRRDGGAGGGSGIGKTDGKRAEEEGQR